MALEYHEAEEITHIKNVLAFFSINVLPLEIYEIIRLLAITIKIKIRFLIQKDFKRSQSSRNIMKSYKF